MPPELGQCAPFRMEEVSRYDERGPAWYWNNFSMGEHTGTHFDAPIHWVTGKELPNNAVDTIPPAHFLAPACVIDCSAESAADRDFVLTIPFVEAWEAQARPHPAEILGPAAHRLAQVATETIRQPAGRRPALPRPRTRGGEIAGGGTRRPRLRHRNDRHRRRPGRAFHPALSGASLHARPRPLRPAMPGEPRPTAAHRRLAADRAAENPPRLRQSAACPGPCGGKS